MTNDDEVRDRTNEIRELWENTPKFVLEAGLSGDPETLLNKSMECMSWVRDFQLKYKDEFAPFTGLDKIIN